MGVCVKRILNVDLDFVLDFGVVYSIGYVDSVFLDVILRFASFNYFSYYGVNVDVCKIVMVWCR